MVSYVVSTANNEAQGKITPRKTFHDNGIVHSVWCPQPTMKQREMVAKKELEIF